MTLNGSITCLRDRPIEEFFEEWSPVFVYTDKKQKHGMSLEKALKRYAVSRGFPGSDQTVKLKEPYDEAKNYFVHQNGDKTPMLWKLDIPEGIFYFSWGYIVLPSGIVLTTN